MEQVSTHTNNGHNAWGGYTPTSRTRYKVEASDVGRTYHDYRGQGHASYTFTTSDVGRHIELIRIPSDPSYRCWTFI